MRHPYLTALCFALCKKEDLSDAWNDFKPDEKFLESFSTFLHGLLVVEPKLPAKTIQVNLERHVATNERLRDLFARIYALMTGEISDPSLNFHREDNAALAEKICEGITHCSEGVEGRLNTLWLGWYQNNTLGDFLQTFREELVAQAAQLSNDVHVQEAVWDVAEKNNFGVTRRNRHDTYVPSNYESHTLPVVQEKFLNFVPLNIIVQIELQIRSRIRMFDYKGLLPCDKSYVYGVYQSIQNYLNEFFGVDENWFKSAEMIYLISPEMDEYYGIVDVDWEKVRTHIVQKVVKEGFFLTTDDYKNWLSSYNYQSELSLFFDIFPNCLLDELDLAISKGLPFLTAIGLEVCPRQSLFVRACRSTPSVMENILDRLKQEPPETIRGFFLAKDQNGFTSLHMIILWQEALLPKCLELIPPDILGECLTAQTINQETPVHFAVQKGIHVSNYLFPKIPEQVKIGLYLTQDTQGESLLTKAIQRDPKLIPMVWENAPQICREIAASQHWVYNKGNALVLACQFAPDWVPTFFNHTDPQYLSMFLGDIHPLFLAAKFQPKALEFLLTTEYGKKQFLEKLLNGDTLLLIAAQYQSEAIEIIRKACTEEEFTRLLHQKNNFGVNVIEAGLLNKNGFPQALLPYIEDDLFIKLLTELNVINNVVSSAVVNKWKLLELLKMRQGLTHSMLKTILTNKNNLNYSNAFLLAARFNKNMLEQMLTDPQFRTVLDECIEESSTVTGDNLLAQAAYQSVETVELLLDNLQANVTLKLLLNDNNYSTKPLHIMAMQCPRAILSIMRAIPQPDRVGLHQLKSRHGLTFLQTAIRFKLSSLLEMIREEEPELKEWVDIEGFTELALKGVQLNPELYFKLLAMVPTQERLDFISATNELGLNAFSIALEHRAWVLKFFEHLTDEELQVCIENAISNKLVTPHVILKSAQPIEGSPGCSTI